MFAVGVLLLSIAAVARVALSFVQHSDKVRRQEQEMRLSERELDLQYEKLRQYEFELRMIKVAELEVPVLFEKKSGATYRCAMGASPPVFEQMQYTQLVSGAYFTLPFPLPRRDSPGAELTDEERKKLLEQLKERGSSSESTRLDFLPDQAVPSGSIKADQ